MVLISYIIRFLQLKEASAEVGTELLAGTKAHLGEQIVDSVVVDGEQVNPNRPEINPDFDWRYLVTNIIARRSSLTHSIILLVAYS